MSEQRGNTAAEAGWHVSRYNLTAPSPDSDGAIIANLVAGTCEKYGAYGLFLMSSLDVISERHPAVTLLARRGVICNYDELAAIDAQGRIGCGRASGVSLTICPTLQCNFDCPYCFEDRVAGKMTTEVQDDVVGLAERMLEASGARSLSVLWYGGEPLLAPDIIESLTERFVALSSNRDVEYHANIVTNGYLLDRDMADLLARCGVEGAQITLDGVGEAHDTTRHLIGGGPTFGRIAENLGGQRLPFPIGVRHNIRKGNRGDVGKVEEFVAGLARKSGNELSMVTGRIVENNAFIRRGGTDEATRGDAAKEVALQVDAPRFGPGRAWFCSANSLWSVGVDPLGNLCKCTEAPGDARCVFGSARDWNPADPLDTASNPDVLTGYLNAHGPITDPECRACVWLPHCAGGCPHKRLYDTGRACVPYRDDPEAFVLAVYRERLGDVPAAR